MYSQKAKPSLAHRRMQKFENKIKKHWKNWLQNDWISFREWEAWDSLVYTGACIHAKSRSYFSRREDGIPVPALNLFMRGYKILFTIDISSKTLENSYLVKSRQSWTNKKQFWSIADGMDGANGPLCALCSGRENTMHLMFECKQYSEPIWKLLENATNETLTRISDREKQLQGRIEMHAFLVLYRVWVGAPSSQSRAIMALIQEI